MRKPFPEIPQCVSFTMFSWHQRLHYQIKLHYQIFSQKFFNWDECKDELKNDEVHWKLKMILFDFSQIGTSWIRNQQTQSHVCRRGWEGFHWRTLWTNLRIRRLRPISGHWCHAKDLTFASSYKLGFIWKYTTFECGHWHWFFILLNIFSKLQILIITANNSRKIRLQNSIGMILNYVYIIEFSCPRSLWLFPFAFS